MQRAELHLRTIARNMEGFEFVRVENPMGFAGVLERR